jgi:hypothetical protein
MDKPEDLIQAEVAEVLELQKSVESLELELSQNELFQNFLIKQKEARAEIDATWKLVEQQMINHDVKSIKGPWGSITIAERQNFKGNIEDVPAKFIKKTLDTTKVATYYTLEGKLPKGIERTTTKYLTKRIKD